MFGSKTDRPGGAMTLETLIGRQTEVLGDLRFSGGLHVDGCVKGSITSVGDKASLSISEGGVVEGSVNVDVISLNGTVVGDVHAAHNLTLGPKAKVTGDVEYTILEMEPGAAINGRLVHQGGAASPEALMHELGAARDSGAKSKQEAKLEPKLEPEVESV